MNSKSLSISLCMIVKDEGKWLAQCLSSVVSIVQEIIAANPGQAEDFKSGKTKLMGYFVGQLMQKTKGKANPKIANELFSKELSK